MVLSADSENDPDVIAVTAASAAAFVSDLPFTTPIAAVRVGLLDGQLVANPTVAAAEDQPAQHRRRRQRRGHRHGRSRRAGSLRRHRRRSAELRPRAGSAHHRRHPPVARPAQAEQGRRAAAAVRRSAGQRRSRRTSASACTTPSTPPSTPRRKAITWSTRSRKKSSPRFPRTTKNAASWPCRAFERLREKYLPRRHPAPPSPSRWPRLRSDSPDHLRSRPAARACTVRRSSPAARRRRWPR